MVGSRHMAPTAPNVWVDATARITHYSSLYSHYRRSRPTICWVLPLSFGCNEASAFDYAHSVRDFRQIFAVRVHREHTGDTAQIQNARDDVMEFPDWEAIVTRRLEVISVAAS